MSEGKYPVLFYEYAFSGKAKCHACVEKIKQGQNIFVFMGNLYHDICSKDFKERERLDKSCFY